MHGIGHFTFCRAPLRFALVAAALALLLLAWPPVESAAGGRKELPDRLILQVRPGARRADVQGEIARQGGRVVGRIDRIGLLVAELPPGKGRAARAKLTGSPRFEFVEPDALLPPAFIPDDPRVTDAWHLGTVDLFTAWDFTTGSPDSPIAILDSGVDPDHPDLAGKLLPGWNFYDNNADTADTSGHGTLVAGVAAAAGNNGIGVAGPAYANPIMPLRVTNPDGWGLQSAIVSALTWAADNGAKVANLSFGGVHNSSAITSAAQYFTTRGGVVTVSAGNAGTDDGSPDNPYMVSVSATASTDLITSWSSFGSYVDVAAPGSGVWTTANGGTYTTASGTSFSAPLAAGVIALIFSADPYLTPPEAEVILEETADDLGPQGFDPSYGWGRINAATAVAAALAGGSPAPDTTAPLATLNLPAEGAILSGSVPISATAVDDIAVTEVRFYVDGQFLAADPTEPYSALWDTLAAGDGTHTLHATAYDAAGNSGDSQTVTVQASNPAPAGPGVVFIDTPDGALVHPKKHTFTVSVSGPDPILHVEFLVDGIPQGKKDKRPPFEWRAPTGKWEEGLHVVTARAADLAGNTGEASITVTRPLSEKEKKKLQKKLAKEEQKKLKN